jgi:hypothetical protein
VNAAAKSSMSEHEKYVFSRAVALNSRIAAIITGFVSGATIWLATAILLWKGGNNVGENLAVIGTFLTGYRMTWGGAWMGFLWGALLGGVAGWIMYSSYAITLRTRVERLLASESGIHAMRVPTFVLDGNALGIGLGALAGTLIFAMTGWLVLRGTAEVSMHAALVGSVLPGYTVSIMGGLIGALEVFFAAYIWSQLFALLYNKLARRRREIDR